MRVVGSSVVRRLLLVLLVPVVWLGTAPEMASAATAGQVLRFNMDRLGPDIQCQMEVTYGRLLTSTAQIRVGAGWCSMRSVDGPLSGCEVLQSECTTVQFDIPGCKTGMLPDQDQASSEWYRTTLLVGPLDLDVGAACNPSQACLYIKSEIGWSSDLEESQCIDIDFSDGFSEEPDDGGYPPPVDPGTCDAGAPQGVAAREVDMGFGLVKDEVKMVMLSRWADGTSDDHWNLSLAHGPVSTGPSKEVQNTASQGNWLQPELWHYNPAGTGLGGSHNPNPPIWGVQVTSNSYGVTGEQFGYTDPSRCTFYFGPKIRTEDSPLYGESDPWSPMVPWDAPPPPPPEEVPEPPTTQVPTGDVDANAGWLTGLLDALGDLIKGILDGLLGLFVPSPGFFEEQLDRVKDAWDDTAPGQLLGTVVGLDEAFTAPSNGGCAGPGLTLRGVSLPGGPPAGSTELHPFSTCSEPMANFAAVVRIALQVTCAVGAGLAGFRILAGGIGVRETPGAAR